MQERLARAISGLTRPERLGPLVWIVALQFFVVQGIVQSAWTTPFSLAHNMISDLARETCGPLFRAPGIEVACSPLHQMMNSSILANGFLIPAGVLLTRPRWPAGPLMSTGLAMIALTAPGHLLVALWPSDSGPVPHMVGAGIILALGNPGMILAGIAAWPARRHASRASLLMGIAGAGGTLLFLAGVGAGIGLGGMERVAFYPLTIWCGIQGMLLLRRTDAAEQGDVPG